MDVSNILVHPRVAAVSWEGDRTKLALVFCKAFENKERFPIDFDDAWSFTGYSNKAHGVRKLKSGVFNEGYDFICRKGLTSSGELTSTDEDLEVQRADKYFMTTHAFEHFAMSSPTTIGHRVREFFIAIRDAMLETERTPSPDDRLEVERERTKQMEWQYLSKKLDYRMAQLNTQPSSASSSAEEISNQVEGTSIQRTVAPTSIDAGNKMYKVPERLRYAKLDCGTTLFSAYDIIALNGYSNPRRTWKSYHTKIFNHETGTHTFDKRGGPTPALTFAETCDLFGHFNKQNPIIEEVVEPQGEQVRAETTELVLAQLQTLTAAVSALASRKTTGSKAQDSAVSSERRRLEVRRQDVRQTTDGLLSIYDKLAVEFPTGKRDKVRRDFHAAHESLGDSIHVVACHVVAGTRTTACCNAEDLEKICEKIRSKQRTENSTTEPSV